VMRKIGSYGPTQAVRFQAWVWMFENNA
jgi:hypothetical protein